ncbi:MAG: S8 family serine peptidase [Gillisia sp.]
MKAPKYPFYYFLILFGVLVLSILFWIYVFISGYINDRRDNTEYISEQVYWSRDYLPENIGHIIPVDTTKIITDSINNRRIISNLVNIAVKNPEHSIARFAGDFKEKYPSEDYEIIFIDSVINRIQVRLPEENRIEFKVEVKNTLDSYNLLVWDETLFDYVKVFTDPMLSDNRANWYLEAINISDAWKKTTGNENIIIAVIDNGFDLEHPELQNQSFKPYNVIDRTPNVLPNEENHGTHISSTIIGNSNNNEGLLGICPDCKFMPIKIQDQNGMMTNTYIIDAILYAIKNGASIINLSLGMMIPPNVQIPLQVQMDYINSFAKDEEEFWKDLFQYADDNNITCVLAAGNSNMLTGFDSFQRSPSTIKVGALDPNFNKAGFSNFGDQTTIYAPGVGIFGARSGNGYEYLEGTSMAAPIVSGFIGLIKSNNPNITNKEIFELLQGNEVSRNGLNILNSNMLN